MKSRPKCRDIGNITNEDLLCTHLQNTQQHQPLTNSKRSQPYYTLTSRRPQPEDIDYWGGCPVCWRNDGYLNVGRDHWFICDKHHVRWYAGSNLFESWREQTEDSFRANAALIGPYREVEEVTPPHPEVEGTVDDEDDIQFFEREDYT